MRMPEFNKLKPLTLDSTGRQVTTICLFCKETEIDIKDWNKRCPKCREKQRVEDEKEMAQIDMGIGKRLPAAVIEVLDSEGNPTGQKVVVDKFGREVEDHKYDLKNDPRGSNVSGIKRSEKEIIK